MGYIIPNTITTDNIYIQKHNQYYVLRYNLDYIQLSGISLCLHQVQVQSLTSGYNLYIHNQETLDTLLKLDSYFRNKIPSYRRMLQYDGRYFIFLKQNKYTSTLKSKYDTFHINVVKLKQGASYTHPIVYIVE